MTAQNSVHYHIVAGTFVNGELPGGDESVVAIGTTDRDEALRFATRYIYELATKIENDFGLDVMPVQEIGYVGEVTHGTVISAYTLSMGNVVERVEVSACEGVDKAHLRTGELDAIADALAENDDEDEVESVKDTIGRFLAALLGNAYGSKVIPGTDPLSGEEGYSIALPKDVAQVLEKAGYGLIIAEDSPELRDEFGIPQRS